MEIRRKVKNVVYKYSEAERYVREATSNDPWGPSTTMMSTIADMTHNHYAFEDVMQLIWKRMNDKGKNWRHVYKALVLLEYLVKCGNDRVASECSANIHTIQTLKDFQYFEEHKDLGAGIREKSKSLVALLKDQELLENEKEKGKKVKAKFHRPNSSLGSHQLKRPGELGREIRKHHNRESRPPQRVMKLNFDDSKGDDDDELQRAIQLSKKEHELAMKKRAEEEANEELKLKMVIEQSKKEEEVLSGLKPPPKQKRVSLVNTSDKNINHKDVDISKLREASSVFESLHGETLDMYKDPAPKKSELINPDDPWASDIQTVVPPNFDSMTNNQFNMPNNTIIFGGLDFDPWAANEFKTTNIQSVQNDNNNNGSMLIGVNSTNQSAVDKSPWGASSIDTLAALNKRESVSVKAGARNNSIVEKIFGDEKPNTQFVNHVNFDASSPQSKDGASNQIRKLSLTNNFEGEDICEIDAKFDPWATGGVVIDSKIKEPRNVNTGSLASLNDLTDYRGEEKMIHSLSVMDLSNKKQVTPQEFLGENANLVNFDNLVPAPKSASQNPFGASSSTASSTILGMSSIQPATASNPFNNPLANPPKVPMNQLGGNMNSGAFTMAPNNSQFGAFNDVNYGNSSMGFTGAMSNQNMMQTPFNNTMQPSMYNHNMSPAYPNNNGMMQPMNSQFTMPNHMPIIMATSQSGIGNNAPNNSFNNVDPWGGPKTTNNTVNNNTNTNTNNLLNNFF